MSSAEPNAAPHATAEGAPAAVVFPGQGSQRPGMALPWVGHPAATRWAEADEVLGRDVTRLGTVADAAELREPAQCQIALFVHQAVLYDAWRAGAPRPFALAGHSLGEYNALYAAGVLSFPAALRLVHARARATQDAAAASPGGMVACLGCDPAEVKAACQGAGAYLANDNAEGQVVVAGSLSALDELAAALAGRGGRVIRLEVGAAYHSPHMQPAVAPLAAALEATEFRNPTVPVVANVDGALHGTGTDWRDLLRRQLTRPVQWRATMETLVTAGVGAVVELSASPVLTGLAKRTAPALQRHVVSEPEHVAVPA